MKINQCDIPHQQMKDIKHMTLLDAVKAFDKDQYPFNNIGIKGNFLNIGHLQKAHSWCHNQWYKARMPTLATSMQHNTGSISKSNQTRKDIKGIWVRKGEVKLPLFAGGMILYVENSEDSTHKHTQNLLELINKYTHVARYNINTQKSVAFLYTNTDLFKKKIKETILSTIPSKRTK